MRLISDNHFLLNDSGYCSDYCRIINLYGYGNGYGIGYYGMSNGDGIGGGYDDNGDGCESNFRGDGTGCGIF